MGAKAKVVWDESLRRAQWREKGGEGSVEGKEYKLASVTLPTDTRTGHTL